MSRWSYSWTSETPTAKEGDSHIHKELNKIEDTLDAISSLCEYVNLHMKIDSEKHSDFTVERFHRVVKRLKHINAHDTISSEKPDEEDIL